MHASRPHFPGTSVASCSPSPQNEYMLYYICPMHTLFTVMVYGALALAPHLNKSNVWLWAK